MAKLYFRYGAMGSSKSAQALITKFNYEEKGMHVWLLKPAIDNRDGKAIVKSRVGLTADAEPIAADLNILQVFQEREREFYDVIIADEAQFFTMQQIEQLRDIVDLYHVPVFCYGLRTDFRTKAFAGSIRLFELADSISELKTVCSCGNKAIVNARIDENGKVVVDGEQIFLGGNESYEPMCYRCWNKAVKKEQTT